MTEVWSKEKEGVSTCNRKSFELMSIRFKCACGRALKAPDVTAGKQIACPACKKPVRIPASSPAATARPIREKKAESDETLDSAFTDEVWDALPPADTPTLPRQSLPRQTKSRINWRVPVTLLAVLAVVAAVTVAGWVGFNALSNALKPGTGEIEDNFMPMLASPVEVGESGSSITETAASNPAIGLGNEFAAYASVRDVPSAIGMIDRDLFQQRQMGPKGCYLSQRYKLTAKEVLAEASKYALESTTSHGGKRLWQTIGMSQFDGLTGVMLRYYSEPRAPFEIFEEKEVSGPVAELLDFDEFLSVGPDLFAFPQYKAPAKGGHSEYRSEISRDVVVGWNAGILPPRTGYVLLLLDGDGQNAKICDLVNVLGQQPLSRSCGPMFELGWTMFRASGEAKPGLEKLLGSPFGDKPQKLTSYIVSEKPPPGYWLLPNGRHRIRAVRLEQVSRAAAGPVFEIKVGEDNGPINADLGTLVQQFREDFPGDLGADMAVVVIAMMPNEPRFYDSNTDQIVESATRLHQRLGDPFLLYVLGLAAQSKGDTALARKHFTAALDAGFEAVDLHRFFITQAAAEQDKEELKKSIARLNDYWNTADRPKNEQLQNKFASRWRAHRKAQEPPPPTLADHMRSNADAQRSRALSGPRRPSFPGVGRGNPNAGGSGPGRGQGHQPGSRPPLQPGTGRPAGSSGPDTGWVVIEITYTSQFNGQAAMTRLKSELGVGNHSMRQSGKHATIKLGFTGPIDQVVELIDFGTVSNVDENKRTITVNAD